MVCVLFRFSVKVGILGGAVYYSKLIGVWDDSITTNKLLSDSMKAVYPYIYTVEERLPVEVYTLVLLLLFYRISTTVFLCK